MKIAYPNDLKLILTVDASSPSTTQALVNELKAKTNQIVKAFNQLNSELRRKGDTDGSIR